MSRYTIHHIADADCASLSEDILAATDDQAEAQRLAAQHSSAPYGAGIRDTETGAIDVGFGFGVKAPDAGD